MKFFILSTKNRGIALIALYSIIAVVLVIISSFAFRVINSYKLAEIARFRMKSYFMARGGCEEAMNQIAIYEANKQTMAMPDPWTWPTPSMSCDSTITQLPDPKPADNVVYYRVDTTANPVFGGNTYTVTVHQVVAAVERYPWQFVAFYDDDLEILPGPNMVLSGKVHTNADMYLGANNTLTLDTEYVHAVGDIYNLRKDEPSTPGGDVLIKVKDSDPATFELMWNRSSEPSPLDSRHPDWVEDSQTRWNGTVQSGAHGVTKLEPADIRSIQPGGYYQDNADLNVVVDSVGATTVLDRSGLPVTLPEGTITESSVYNHREKKWVTLTNINISLLNDSGHYPANGLLYATRQDASAENPDGIRLINGQRLAGPLTVVSNDPVYVQGDFNKLSEGKQPAGIISDSINLFSNKWIDANSSKGLSSRRADYTEINAAFIAGVDETSSGSYNGGLENYPRLHEDWSGKTLTIRGSFVELWASEIAQGKWQYGSPQYTAPVRDWHYDSDFDTLTNLPPFSPYVIELQRLSWWQEA